MAFEWPPGRNYSATYNCPQQPGDRIVISGTIFDNFPPQVVLTDDGKYVAACSAYLRISSEDGTKLAGAKVTAGTPYPDPLVADRYGRVFLAAPLKSTRRVAISAAGYSTESIDIGCGERAAVRIPASILQAAHFDLDEVVDVREEAGRIVIEPVRQKTYDLDDLLKGITTRNRNEAVDFARPSGREVW